MNKVRLDELRRLFTEQVSLLSHNRVAVCANRSGIRNSIADRLETAFIELATALAPELSVEVGAHEARFSERLKTRCPDLHALSFEANPNVFKAHVAGLRDQSIGV